ncbi:hypothetical protein [Cohaesibacter haloalkalitolerans]|uniref:hypothetical protein n=1 Tax=Cohaesibacter haloalkalitolerans TaxID=1162980 RepID=UPI0013C4A221|nr:hypothetical protein [Cohaesibacter haloalkalitolerans]
MKTSVGLLATQAAAVLALIMTASLAEANPGYGGYEAGPDYESQAPVVAAVPDVDGKVYLEATYDPALGAYVYPERIEVQVDPYHAPIPYRVKRIHYDGYTPVIGLPTR